MRSHLRLVFILAVVLIAYGVLMQAFHLLNQASDRALYGGIGVVLVLLLIVPLVVREIWRKL
jgi:uncharacterized membrane protein YcjF (UPF0283 family)